MKQHLFPPVEKSEVRVGLGIHRLPHTASTPSTGAQDRGAARPEANRPVLGCCKAGAGRLRAGDEGGMLRWMAVTASLASPPTTILHPSHSSSILHSPSILLSVCTGTVFRLRRCPPQCSIRASARPHPCLSSTTLSPPSCFPHHVWWWFWRFWRQQQPANEPVCHRPFRRVCQRAATCSNGFRRFVPLTQPNIRASMADC